MKLETRVILTDTITLFNGSWESFDPSDRIYSPFSVML